LFWNPQGNRKSRRLRPTVVRPKRKDRENPGTLQEGMHKRESAGCRFSTTHVPKRNGYSFPVTAPYEH
jgi:hypothetical protein